ncbi:unnamed protein product [Durusdinium trenchii]|uniref:Uncharacterized protein n=1 Tax=Durusdinium trenchii TaxID=1381693 RepID=A0ABP0RKP9_9DINO
MFSMTPILMRRYSVHSELGVGLVASSFALGRFCRSERWAKMGENDSAALGKPGT